MSDKQDGRNPFDQEKGQTRSVIKDLVATAADTPWQKKDRERFPSELTRSKITLDLQPETITTLRQMAEGLGAKKRLSAIVQALVDYALVALEEDRVELQPRVGTAGIVFELVGEGNEK